MTHVHSHGKSDLEHEHHHGHAHAHVPNSLKALVGVISLTATVFFAELIAGFLSGSLALLADAAHMFSDSAGLIIALLALLIGRKGASKRATYGYRRAEVLAAAFNAATVGLIAIWIGVEAVLRIGHQHEVETGMMLIVAVIGLLVNGISAFVLMRQSHKNMNLRGAYLHVLTDMLGSIAVIIAGLVIRFTGFVIADTVASLLIALFIVPQAWKLFKNAINVLLEAAPAGVHIERIEHAIAEIPGVVGIHDLHIWSVTGEDVLVTCHVVTDVQFTDQCALLDQVTDTLAAQGVGHSTIQLESAKHYDHEVIEH
ncbi:cation diffusion facilitator family transporter [Corynebacterium freiburgense]|uniref:cation diffusion facilitator family transporter n=1 Tax=Corynebacterium freiburgense TaxID=556548 RepID=UPI000478AB71|nr:cation diffusion facilitator family transporter [Corynebacterium freiburgense]WJZ02443.1 Cadmium, cobalt and zinc/H(+)-K(+) antiporter [Corynebacterium freiburgense]